MPYLEALVKHSAAPLSALDTYQELCERISPEALPELISAWCAYDLATRVGVSWCVMPPRGLKGPGKAKAPIRDWKANQSVRPSDAELWQWYIKEQQPGVGLVLGRVSDGLHCLDWEGRAIKSGYYAACMVALEQAGLGEVWQRIARYAERTPSGGLHYFYRLSQARRKAVIAKTAHLDKADPMTGTYLEDLGQGEYAVIAPSHQVDHRGTYTPLPALYDINAVLTQDADTRRTMVLEQVVAGHLYLEGPLMHVDDINALHEVFRNVAREHGLNTPTPDWDKKAKTPSSSSSALPRVAPQPRDTFTPAQHVGDMLKALPHIDDLVVGWLEQGHGQRTQGARGTNGAIPVTRPGKSPVGADNISGLVGGEYGQGMFVCFSSSWSPYADIGKRAYTPLDVFTITTYGDLSKTSYASATTYLERQFGITPTAGTRKKGVRA